MISLIFAVVFAILVATFAVQNRGFVDVRFGTYLLTGVPVYLLVLASVLLTLLFAGVLFLVHNVSSYFTIHSKDATVRKFGNQNRQLEQKVNELEVENEKLKEAPREHNRTHFFPIGRRTV